MAALTEGRRWWRRGWSLPRLSWLVASVAAAAAGQLSFARQLPLLEGLFLYGVALFLFLRGCRDLEEGEEEEHLDDHRAWVPRPSRLVGALLLSALGASGMALWRFSQGPADSSAWLLFFVSIAFFLLASFLWQRSHPFRRELPRAASVSPGQKVARIAPWLLLAGITLLAFCLRVYRIEELPFGLWYDEASSGLDALRILKEPGYHPVYTSSSNSPSADVHLTALALQSFGQGVFALRIGSVLVGTLTVPALFLLGRELLGLRLALVAAFLMAVSRWDITFSRLGMQGATTPLLTVLAAFFLLHGFRTHRPSSFAAAGLVLGAGLWFYPSLRLFPLVLLFYVGVLLLADLGLLRRSWQGLALLVVVAGLAAAPVLLYAALNSDIFFDRTVKTSVFAEKTLGEAVPTVLSNAQKHLLMFNRQGDSNGRHNLPGEPALDHATGLLAVLGLGYALSRWRKPKHMLLLVWFLVMLSAGVLSLEFEAPQSLRSVGVLPAAILLPALAVGQFASAFREAAGPGRMGWFWAAVVVLLGFIGYNNVDTYFNRQAHDFASWNAGSTAETIIGYRLRALPQGDQDVYLSSIYWQHPTVRFLAPSWQQRYRPFDVSQTLPLQAGKDTVLFLEPQHLTAYHQVREYYPDAACQEVTLRLGDTPPILYPCTLDSGTITSVQGLEGRYSSLVEGADSSQVIRRESSPVLEWGGQDGPLAPFQAEWAGALHAPSYGSYRFALEGDSPATLYLGDTLVLDRMAQEGAVTLARGLHALRVAATVTEPKGVLRLLWQPPGEGWGVIPSSSLYHGPVQALGLLGSYYLDPEWNGPPAFQQVDPSLAFYFHVTPLPRPYSVEWEGKLYAPQEGVYRFGTENIGSSLLTIDGQLVVANPLHNRYLEGAVALSAGWHEIRVRFQDDSGYSHLYLYWTPPGGTRELVPSAHLRPSPSAFRGRALP